MNVAHIEGLQTKSNIIFDTAKKIRALLDEAREAYGSEAWDDEGKQDELLELVTEEVTE